jgi:predicted cupin superfamily sugar epimerase
MTFRPATAELLDLEPHPEGGWYRRTYSAATSVRPAGYPGSRPTATAIHYLLEPGQRSAWHSVRSDELWLWHSGGPLALNLGGTGSAPAHVPSRIVVGADLAAGQVVQALVPAGTWQSAEPVEDREVLLSCVVSPGFDFADFTLR